MFNYYLSNRYYTLLLPLPLPLCLPPNLSLPPLYSIPTLYMYLFIEFIKNCLAKPLFNYLNRLCPVLWTGFARFFEQANARILFHLLNNSYFILYLPATTVWEGAELRTTFRSQTVSRKWREIMLASKHNFNYLFLVAVCISNV